MKRGLALLYGRGQRHTLSGGARAIINVCLVQYCVCPTADIVRKLLKSNVICTSGNF